MNKIIAVTLFAIMLVCLLANPAPVSIELADLVLISLPCLLGVLSIAAINNFKMQHAEMNLLIAIIIYLSYLLCSMLIGLMHGVPLLNVLRSLGPYINFFPLLFLGLLPTRLLNPWMLASILILVGSFQAGYQIYLYITHSLGGTDTLSVLRSRITLIEPRTTLPIVLSITVIPMVLFFSNKMSYKVLASCLILSGLFAAAATLTRSIIISIVIGWITFALLSIYYQSRSITFSYKSLLLKFGLYLLIFTVLIMLLSLIPKIYQLEQGLLARFAYHSSAGSDYSNGRLYDEWLPALTAWVNSGTISLLFGMGAGSAFTVGTGEERTYIHNLVIYSLVYGGIYGLFACLWLYFTIFKTLLIRALESRQIIYFGFAGLLASLFTYAQLFAVHKGLAFNAMLFLIIALALSQPRKQA